MMDVDTTRNMQNSFPEINKRVMLHLVGNISEYTCDAQTSEG